MLLECCGDRPSPSTNAIDPRSCSPALDEAFVDSQQERLFRRRDDIEGAGGDTFGFAELEQAFPHPARTGNDDAKIRPPGRGLQEVDKVTPQAVILELDRRCVRQEDANPLYRHSRTAFQYACAST